MENKGSIIKLSLILLAIAFISTLILTVCNAVTKDTIAYINEQNIKSAMLEVLPGGETFEEIGGEYPEYITSASYGKKDGDIMGYTVNVSVPGFGGNIEMIIGVCKQKTVTGVKITSLSETPGLGAKASNEEFTKQYYGLEEGISVIKSGMPNGNEISAISGATITSKAVTEGVNAALKYVGTLE